MRKRIKKKCMMALLIGIQALNGLAVPPVQAKAASDVTVSLSKGKAVSDVAVLSSKGKAVSDVAVLSSKGKAVSNVAVSPLQVKAASGRDVSTVQLKAATGLTLSQLRAKFPHGKYWNHAGNPGSSNSVNNQDGYTSTPCKVHGVVGTSKQTCNGFQPFDDQLSHQCMGYAEKSGYDATGFNPRVNANGWNTIRNASALNTLKAGDIVRYKNDRHSIYVTAVAGDTVTYTDCNSDGHCMIKWNQRISKPELRATFTYLRSAPFEMKEEDRKEEEEDEEPVIPSPEIQSVSLRSIDCTGFSLCCSVRNAGLVKVNVESVESGRMISDSFTDGLESLSYQFDADRLPSGSGCYRVLIYAYTTPDGGNETLHRATFGSEPEIVTLPPTIANPELAYLLDPLVFDADFYAAYNEDLAKAGITTKLQLVRHWIFSGSVEGRWANPVLNVRDYVAMNQDIAEAFGVDYRAAICHFVQFGCREARKTSRVFWCGYYLEKNPDVAAATGTNIRSVYEHYLAFGIREGRAGSPLYIPETYRNNYKDLQAAYDSKHYYELMMHWLKWGQGENRNAVENITVEACLTHPYVFDPVFYAAVNPDLKEAGIVTVEQLTEHWQTLGYKEGRWAHPLFWVRYYLDSNPDLKAEFGGDYLASIEHFVKKGCCEMRDSSCLFSPAYYRDHNPDVAEMAGNDSRLLYEHMISYGIAEGRESVSSYNPVYYMENYEDLKAAYEGNYYGLMIHWILFGNSGKEKRIADRRLEDTQDETGDAKPDEAEVAKVDGAEIAEPDEAEIAESDEVEIAEPDGKETFNQDENRNGIEYADSTECGCMEEKDRNQEDSWAEEYMDDSEQSVVHIIQITDRDSSEGEFEDKVDIDDVSEFKSEDVSGVYSTEVSEADIAGTPETVRREHSEAEFRKPSGDELAKPSEVDFEEPSECNFMENASEEERKSGITDPMMEREKDLKFTEPYPEGYPDKDLVKDLLEKQDNWYDYSLEELPLMEEYRDDYFVESAVPNNDSRIDNSSNDSGLLEENRNHNSTEESGLMEEYQVDENSVEASSLREECRNDNLTEDSSRQDVRVETGREEDLQPQEHGIGGASMVRTIQVIDTDGIEEDRKVTGTVGTMEDRAESEKITERISTEQMVAAVFTKAETETEDMAKQAGESDRMDLKSDTASAPDGSVAQIVYSSTDINAQDGSKKETNGNGGEKKKFAKPGKVTKLRVKSKKKNSLSVSFKKMTGADGYELSWSTDRRFGKKNRIVLNNVVTFHLIKGLKSGSRYYVRVRAYRLNPQGKREYGKYRTIRSGKVR